MSRSFQHFRAVRIVRKPASGFTLIEVGITSVLLALLTSGFLLFLADQLRTSSAEAQGTALLSLNDAVNGYEAQFAANLANHTAVPIPGYGNVANPYSPTSAELTELGLLNSAIPVGVYGISINPTVVNGEPSGMTWIVKPFTDNLGRPSQDLAGAAMTSAGGDGAMSTLATPSVVTGVSGWSATNPQTNTAAIVAMRNGAGSGAFLKLNGSTPMQGNLNLSGFSVANAGNVSASGTVSGNTLSATGNVTGSNVAASGNVTASNVSASGSTSGSTLTATAWGNDVFFGTSALYSDGWNSVIRNANGALYVQNFAGSAEPVVASQFIGNQFVDSAGGNGVQIGNSYYYGDSVNSAIRQNGMLYVQNQAGNGPANVDLAYVNVNGTATVGWGCSPNGQVAQDGSGHLLSCVNGVWHTPLASAGIRYVYSGYGNVINPDGNYPDVGYAQCNWNEMVIGGGASCADGANGWVTTSMAQGNGWVANCYGHEPGNVNVPQDTPAEAMAVCLTIQ